MVTGAAHRPLAQTAGARWARASCQMLAVALLLLAAWLMVDLARIPWGQGLIASDVLKGYLPGAQRFLDTGSPYTAAQLAGPWTLEVHSFIHPPSALPLFVPFLWLPLPLWWAVPIGLTAYAVRRLRPAPWTWPLMAACLCWPRSTGMLLAGNTDMWAMAAVAAGAVWGWPAVAIMVKPTFAPLALVAVRRRSAWIAGVVGVALMLPFLGLWLDWLRVIGNQGGLGFAYSLLNLPLVALPVVAWAGRSRA